jgi:cephalosporin-C deacetylase
MDTRGQGTVTPDPDAADDVAGPGFLTRGLSGPGGHYYRRVFADAVRAVGAARSHPAVDGSVTAVTGTSQGGGIALAVAGLVPGLAAVMPDVPFLCDFPRAAALADCNPYAELPEFFARRREHAEAAMRTLSYIDAVCHARRASAPTLFSVALMDHICPPSTVYAAFNAYPAQDKQISVYPYNGHEGGGADHEAVKLRWLAERVGA